MCLFEKGIGAYLRRRRAVTNAPAPSSSRPIEDGSGTSVYERSPVNCSGVPNPGFPELTLGPIVSSDR